MRNQREKIILLLDLMVQNSADILVQIWPIGGARKFEIETPNFLWLILRLSSICVAKFHNFSASSSMGCHRLPEWKKKKKKTDR